MFLNAKSNSSFVHNSYFREGNMLEISRQHCVWGVSGKTRNSASTAIFRVLYWNFPRRKATGDGGECAGPTGRGAGLLCHPSQLIISASLPEREQSTEWVSKVSSRVKFLYLNSDLFYRASLLKSPGYVKYGVLQNMFTITAGTNRPEVYNLASGRLAVFCEKIYHIFICLHMTTYILLNVRCDISKTTYVI